MLNFRFVNLTWPSWPAASSGVPSSSSQVSPSFMIFNSACREVHMDAGNFWRSLGLWRTWFRLFKLSTSLSCIWKIQILDNLRCLAKSKTHMRNPYSASALQKVKHIWEIHIQQVLVKLYVTIKLVQKNKLSKTTNVICYLLTVCNIDFHACSFICTTLNTSSAFFVSFVPSRKLTYPLKIDIWKRSFRTRKPSFLGVNC